VLFIMRFDLRNPAMAGTDLADRYEATLEMAEWADHHGCLAVSLSEHHASDDGYLPSPLVMAAAIAARTTNVAIAINALIAPFYDPLRLAEDVAVVDQISRGRLALTIAAGYADHEFEMFGVSPSDRPAIIRKTVETLRNAWTGEPFEFRGRRVRVQPTPAQAGGPPIILGGSSEGAARRAARIADGFIPSIEEAWPPYRDECLKLGKADPGPGMGVNAHVVFMAEDPEAAWAEYGPYFLHESNAYGAWNPTAGDGAYRQLADVAELRDGDQYRIVTPDEYATHVEVDCMGVARLHPMVGGIPPALAWEQLRLFEKHFL
jgi:alkanesulfonate monooxygenase SsuD/methylene tetrahydromethanopterin reductase-like flavin-dependent oxidoreductase (luciferase family)